MCSEHKKFQPLDIRAEEFVCCQEEQSPYTKDNPWLIPDYLYISSVKSRINTDDFHPNNKQ